MTDVIGSIRQLSSYMLLHHERKEENLQNIINLVVL